LLTLARIEPSSESNYTFEEVNLTRLVQSVTAEWVPRSLNRQIDLGFEAKNNQDLIILGNAFMLKEMLSNLIDNALRYTPQGGEVTVVLSKLDAHVVLEVMDNGIGIAPEERELVFNRFYRVTDSSGDGCGLGLAIVKEIVLAHHAEISIKDGLARNQTDDGLACGTNITINFKSYDR